MNTSPQPVPLWPTTPPGERPTRPEDIPTLSWFVPENPTGAAILICPGGGYQMLADHEADPVAHWLNQLGIVGVILRYRRAPHRHPTPLMDVSHALRTVRHRAPELNLDPHRVGVLGFSAGGHLAATLSTHYDLGDARSSDLLERVSSRPDLSVLLYPVITLQGTSVHVGSRQNLLGDNPSGKDLWDLSLENRVTPDTPPTFLFHTFDDSAVPVDNSLAYARALWRAGVEVELHGYAKGHHGVGLARDNPVLATWTTLCANWLRTRSFAR